MFQDNSGKVIKGLSLNSILASGVPGTVSGLFYASEKFGTKNIKTLIDPSIELARKGFVLSDFQAKNLNKYKKKFSKNEEAKKIFTRPNGFSEGDILVQTNLANTLEKIAQNGKKEFYFGDTANKIANFFQINGGLFKLKRFKPI